MDTRYSIRHPIWKAAAAIGRHTVALLIIAVGLASPGCQAWHSSSSAPGQMSWKEERRIIKQANNDPFPSPSEVGIK